MNPFTRRVREAAGRAEFGAKPKAGCFIVVNTKAVFSRSCMSSWRLTKEHFQAINDNNATVTELKTLSLARRELRVLYSHAILYLLTRGILCKISL